MWSQNGNNLMSIEIMSFDTKDRNACMTKLRCEMTEFSVTLDRTSDGNPSHAYRIIIKRTDGKPISLQEYLNVYQIYHDTIKNKEMSHVDPGYGNFRETVNRLAGLPQAESNREDSFR